MLNSTRIHDLEEIGILMHIRAQIEFYLFSLIFFKSKIKQNQINSHVFFRSFFQEEYRFFLAGGTNRPKSIAIPSLDWISDRSWNEILTLESLKSFETFAEDFKNHLDVYKRIFDSSEPHR